MCLVKFMSCHSHQHSPNKEIIMERNNRGPQERKSYDPPAVVYETELEVHAASSTSTSGSPVFDPLNLDK
jgi:hypothetical protein